MLRFCPLALLIAALCGCQRTPAPFAAVHGRVLYKGSQIPGGLIVFTPDASRGTSGAIAFGKIREDGSYTLFTGEAEGASAGWYRVTVGALVPSAPVSLLPEKYRDPSSSLLACEVKPDRPNQLDFNLD
jgi:hypothetical protein